MEKYYSLEEITDKYIGVRGTAERESFEADVEAALKPTRALVNKIKSIISKH